MRVEARELIRSVSYFAILGVRFLRRDGCRVLPRTIKGVEGDTSRGLVALSPPLSSPDVGLILI